MNQIHISNYNNINEPIIIKELSNILNPFTQYVISRETNKATDLKVSLEGDLSFIQLLNMKNSIESLLEVFQENEQVQVGNVRLIKDHRSIERQLFTKCTFTIKYSIQEFITDTYFYLQLINLDPAKIFPVIIYQMELVFNQCNLLRKDQFYELLLNGHQNKDFTYKQIKQETLATLELEHGAFLRLINREWYKLCININKQIERYMGKVSDYSEDVKYKSDVIERNKVVKKVVKDIYFHVFNFLNNNQIDNNQYLYNAYCIAQQNKHSTPGYFLKRRK